MEGAIAIHRILLLLLFLFVHNYHVFLPSPSPLMQCSWGMVFPAGNMSFKFSLSWCQIVRSLFSFCSGKCKHNHSSYEKGGQHGSPKLWLWIGLHIPTPTEVKRSLTLTLRTR